MYRSRGEVGGGEMGVKLVNIFQHMFWVFKTFVAWAKVFRIIPEFRI